MVDAWNLFWWDYQGRSESVIESEGDRAEVVLQSRIDVSNSTVP